MRAADTGLLLPSSPAERHLSHEWGRWLQQFCVIALLKGPVGENYANSSFLTFCHHLNVSININKEERDRFTV